MPFFQETSDCLPIFQDHIKQSKFCIRYGNFFLNSPLHSIVDNMYALCGYYLFKSFCVFSNNIVLASVEKYTRERQKFFFCDQLANFGR